MHTNKVGGRIRSYREKLNLDLAELSSRTGLAPALLEAIENEDVFPSLGPLLKIARSLGVRLGTFLDDQVSRDPLIVRSSGRSELLTMQPDRGHAAMRYFSLGMGKIDRHMEPFFIELFPEAGDKTLTAHEGEEFIVVVSGQVRLIYGQEEHLLGPGDSMYFNSVAPHHVSCAGTDKAEILAVVYIP